MQLAENPPFVSFALVPVEDREASIGSGSYTTKDVIFAYITPAGSRDRVETEAEQWLQDQAEAERAGRLPSAWLKHYNELYRAFKESREPVLEGHAIKDWPSLSPAQVKQVLDLNVRTVEQLASANEEVVMRLGMGGRALKEKAIAWLASAQNFGAVAEENAALKVELETLKAQVAELRKAAVDKTQANTPQKSTPSK